jgi:predicted Zn-dependent peptidase
LQLIRGHVFNLRERGISKRDLNLFKTQVKGQILLGADDVENRMNSLAVNEMIFGEYRPVDEVISEIDSITVKSVQEYLNRFVTDDAIGLLLIGDLDRKGADALLDEFG